MWRNPRYVLHLNDCYNEGLFFSSVSTKYRQEGILNFSAWCLRRFVFLWISNVKESLDLESVTAKHLEKVCLATNHPDYWYNASFFVFFNHRTVVGKISLFLQISPFHNYMYLFFYLTNTGFFRSIRYCKFLNSTIQPFLIK